MNEEFTADEGKEKSRRGLLALIGAGGAAALAAVLSRSNGAHATHGVLNATSGDGAPAIHGDNTDGGPGVEGTSQSGEAVLGHSQTHFGVVGRSESGPAGVHGFSDSGAGTAGRSQTGDGVIGFSQTGNAVRGISEIGGVLAGGTGILGESGSGPGVSGHSESGHGVHGESDSGPGVSGDSQTGPGVQGRSSGGPPGTPGEGMGVVGDSESGTGVSGFSQSGIGARGISQTFFGVQGLSAGPWAPGVLGESKAFIAPGAPGGSGPGVQGTSGSGPGVEGSSETGPGVKGESQSGNAFEGYSETGAGAFLGSSTGPGVDATSESGPGVVGWTPQGLAGVVGIGSILRGEGTVPEEARGVLGIAPGNAPAVQCVSGTMPEPLAPDPDGGLALDVVGKARFSTAGAGTVLRNQNTAFVANPAVTANSHITVTLAGNPGNRYLQWVERNPGVGFTVRLAQVSAGPRPPTPFTYLIVEPA